MKKLNLEEELHQLVDLFENAYWEYHNRLKAAGNDELAHEWEYNLGDIMPDVRRFGEALVTVYTSPPEQVPKAMKEFINGTVYGWFHAHDHMTRLKDILEGRPPSYPPE